MKFLFTFIGFGTSIGFAGLAAYILQMPQTATTSDLVTVFTVASLGFAIYTMVKLGEMIEDEYDGDQR